MQGKQPTVVFWLTSAVFSPKNRLKNVTRSSPENSLIINGNFGQAGEPSVTEGRHKGKEEKAEEENWETAVEVFTGDHFGLVAVFNYRGDGVELGLWYHYKPPYPFLLHPPPGSTTITTPVLLLLQIGAVVGGDGATALAVILAAGGDEACGGDGDGDCLCCCCRC